MKFIASVIGVLTASKPFVAAATAAGGEVPAIDVHNPEHNDKDNAFEGAINRQLQAYTPLIPTARDRLLTNLPQFKLTADGVAVDGFGHGVAVDGNTAFVGAHESRTVYVFIRNADNTWSQQANLTSIESDGSAVLSFGYRLDVDGDTLVVGCLYREAAYVFVRNGDNTWSQQQKLIATDGSAHFGRAVSVSGDTIVVGAYYDDDKGVGSGAVYVFAWNAGTNSWDQKQKLTASDGVAGDLFGMSVSIDGNTIVVSAPRVVDDKGDRSGSVYVFVWNAGTDDWEEKQKLFASDGTTDDFLGFSLYVDGDTFVAGASKHDSHRGAAYVFTRSADTWSQKQKLTAEGGGAGDALGSSVSIDGNTLVVGAYADDDYGFDSGSAYVFTRNANNTWGQQQKLTAEDGAEKDQFGSAVAVSGSNVVVGAPAYTERSGAAYAFSLVTPWDITFLDMVANFTSASDEELTLTYKVGSGRTIAHSVKAGGCENSEEITGLVLGKDYNVTNSTAVDEGGLDILTLGYSFDKAEIVNSNLWNPVDNKLEACQTVQLTLDGGDTGTMVISELKSNVTVDFDLSANFTLNDVDLDGATILANNDTTTLDDYISAFKCDDINTKSEGDKLKLVPNDELKVCIESTSTDVQIATIDSMKIVGTKPLPEGGASFLDVFNEDGTPKFSAITTVVIENNRLNANPVAMITTRVPPNLFDFETTGAKIDVSGSITVKLAGGRRKLLLGGSDRLLQAGTDNLFDAYNGGEAGFDVIIDLESEDTDEFEGAMMNSGEAFANKVMAIIGMAVATTYMLW